MLLSDLGQDFCPVCVFLFFFEQVQTFKLRSSGLT